MIRLNLLRNISAGTAHVSGNMRKLMQFEGLKMQSPIIGDTLQKTVQHANAQIPKIEVASYNTGIKDDRLAQLLVEKRCNFPVFNAQEFPKSYIYRDSSGMLRQKPFLYINLIEVKPEFARQGVATNTVKKIIELSKKEGYDGRIMLDAIGLPGTKTFIPKSSLQPWKMGFKFVDEEKNKIMEQVFAGKLPLESAPSGTMYYPV